MPLYCGIVSSELEKKLRSETKQEGELLSLPQHKLVGDVVTRWGSTYVMVSRIIEQQQALSSVLVEDRKELAPNANRRRAFHTRSDCGGS